MSEKNFSSSLSESSSSTFSPESAPPALSPEESQGWLNYASWSTLTSLTSWSSYVLSSSSKEEEGKSNYNFRLMKDLSPSSSGEIEDNTIYMEIVENSLMYLIKAHTNGLASHSSLQLAKDGQAFIGYLPIEIYQKELTGEYLEHIGPTIVDILRLEGIIPRDEKVEEESSLTSHSAIKEADGYTPEDWRVIERLEGRNTGSTITLPIEYPDEDGNFKSWRETGENGSNRVNSGGEEEGLDDWEVINVPKVDSNKELPPPLNEGGYSFLRLPGLSWLIVSQPENPSSTESPSPDSSPQQPQRSLWDMVEAAKIF